MSERAHRPGEKIYEGAEATLTAARFLGRDAVVKRRRPKAYRIPQLEGSIAKSRMRNESRLLHRAREAGVSVPALLDADPEDQAMTLEYLGPSSLRATFDELSPSRRRTLARRMGQAVASLHKASIIHGDLTTSNMLLKGGRIHLVDFSLGRISDKTEDRAVDLKAFKDSFEATHHAHRDDFFFVLRGYRGVLGPAADHAVEHITRIEQRRRYA